MNRTWTPFLAAGTILWALLAFTPPLPANAAVLRPGRSLAMGKAVSQQLTLVVDRTGEYRLRTLGKGLVWCDLADRLRGSFARSGGTDRQRNCRLDIRLDAGSYRVSLVNSLGKPYRVRLDPYRTQGAERSLSPGTARLAELGDLGRVSAAVAVGRRQWLSLAATGRNVGHCRLLDRAGWVLPLVATSRRLKGKGGEPVKRCQLQGLVEAGRYSLVVFGTSSLPWTKGPPVAQSSARLEAGERRLQPTGRWHEVELGPTGTTTVWFTAPKPPGLGSLGPSLRRRFRNYVRRWGIVRARRVLMTRMRHRLGRLLERTPRVYLEVRSSTRGVTGRVLRRSWTDSSGSFRASCKSLRPWEGATPSERICRVLRRLLSGGRHVLELRGRPFSKARVRYLV